MRLIPVATEAEDCHNTGEHNEDHNDCDDGLSVHVPLNYLGVGSSHALQLDFVERLPDLLVLLAPVEVRALPLSNHSLPLPAVGDCRPASRVRSGGRCRHRVFLPAVVEVLAQAVERRRNASSGRGSGRGAVDVSRLRLNLLEVFLDLLGDAGFVRIEVHFELTNIGIKCVSRE